MGLWMFIGDCISTGATIRIHVSSPCSPPASLEMHEGYMSHSLNSLKGDHIGDYICDYYKGVLRGILGV